MVISNIRVRKKVSYTRGHIPRTPPVAEATRYFRPLSSGLQCNIYLQERGAVAPSRPPHPGVPLPIPCRGVCKNTSKGCGQINKLKLVYHYEEIVSAPTHSVTTWLEGSSLHNDVSDCSFQVLGIVFNECVLAINSDLCYVLIRFFSLF